MVNTINEARTPGELAAWLRQWARQLAEAVERVCAPGNAEEKAGAQSRPFVGVDLAKGRPTYTCVEIVPGNAAAMRKALERIVNLAPEYPAGGVDWNALAAKAFLTASSALAAPARNCDRFATEDEAREAYWAYREPLEFNNKPFVAITEWLFAPAEGGGHG